MDYAAILSKQDITISEVTQELSEKGWLAFGALLDFEEIPDAVLVWMLFKWDTLGYPNFPIKGYIRIMAKEGTNDRRGYFHVVQSPWYVIAYFVSINAIQVRYKKFKRIIRQWLT